MGPAPAAVVLGLGGGALGTSGACGVAADSGARAWGLAGPPELQVALWVLLMCQAHLSAVEVFALPLPLPLQAALLAAKGAALLLGSFLPQLMAWAASPAVAPTVLRLHGALGAALAPAAMFAGLGLPHGGAPPCAGGPSWTSAAPPGPCSPLALYLFCLLSSSAALLYGYSLCEWAGLRAFLRSVGCELVSAASAASAAAGKEGTSPRPGSSSCTEHAQAEGLLSAQAGGGLAGAPGRMQQPPGEPRSPPPAGGQQLHRRQGQGPPPAAGLGGQATAQAAAGVVVLGQVQALDARLAGQLAALDSASAGLMLDCWLGGLGMAASHAAVLAVGSYACWVAAHMLAEAGGPLGWLRGEAGMARLCPPLAG